jgi:release factor glutamine methyltransferase
MTGPVPLAALVADGVAAFKAVGFESPAMEARALAAGVLGLSREQMLADPKRGVAPEDARRFADAVDRRAAHEPLARITGKKEFWSLDLCVGPDTLIPRPETETVVETVLAYTDDPGGDLSILDLGTGSGCLLLALLVEYPNATGIGVDCAAPALEVAKANAAGLGVSPRAQFVVGDWGAGLSGPFDIVVCNPPYVAEGARASLMTEVRDFEPPRALFAGADGLGAYRHVVPQIANLLAPRGLAVIELGVGQQDAVAGMLADQGLVAGPVRADLAGIPRALPGAKSGKPFSDIAAKKKVGKSRIPV